MLKRNCAVAFTGHRPESLPFLCHDTDVAYQKAGALLLKEILFWAEQGCPRFLCGMARGMDMLFAEQVLQAKLCTGGAVSLICAIPYTNQPERWSDAWRERYFSLLACADERIVLRDTYAKGCFLLRNRYMVDHADALIAVYDGSPSGGSAYTVSYARKLDKPVVVIDPIDLSRTILQ